MRRIIFILLGCATLLSSGGCSTIADLSAGEDGQRIYGGTRRNVKMVHEPNPHAGAISLCRGILDFPFSLALDTGLLPVTLLIEIFESDAPPEKEKPGPR